MADLEEMRQALPTECPQCGRRPDGMMIGRLIAWYESGLTLCTTCSRGWGIRVSADHHPPVLPRCAGCARRAPLNIDHVCSDCAGKVIGLTLPFDDGPMAS